VLTWSQIDKLLEEWVIGCNLESVSDGLRDVQGGRDEFYDLLFVNRAGQGG